MLTQRLQVRKGRWCQPALLMTMLTSLCLSWTAFANAFTDAGSEISNCSKKICLDPALRGSNAFAFETRYNQDSTRSLALRRNGRTWQDLRLICLLQARLITRLIKFGCWSMLQCLSLLSFFYALTTHFIDLSTKATITYTPTVYALYYRLLSHHTCLSATVHKPISLISN